MKPVSRVSDRGERPVEDEAQSARCGGRASLARRLCGGTASMLGRRVVFIQASGFAKPRTFSRAAGGSFPRISLMMGATFGHTRLKASAPPRKRAEDASGNRHTLWSPDVLEVSEMPDPIPVPGELSIDVTHAAVGLVDVFIRQGLYKDRAGLPQPPCAPGLEVAGSIRELVTESMASSRASRWSR